MGDKKEKGYLNKTLKILLRAPILSALTFPLRATARDKSKDENLRTLDNIGYKRA